MKINSISQNRQSSLDFKGYKDLRNTNDSSNVRRFYVPPYDMDKYSASIELVQLTKDENGNWFFNNTGLESEPFRVSCEIEGSTFDMPQEALDNLIKENMVLGYRFVFTPKDEKDKNIITKIDAGLMAQSGDREEFYSVIEGNQVMPKLTGTMYNIYFPSFAPSEKVIKSGSQNPIRKNDTTIKSLISQLEKKNGPFDNYDLILSTPVFGKDTMSDSGYWTANPYQIASKIGTVDDFKELQTKLFDKGKSWIADGAFTSQGLNSYQMQDVIRNGMNSPYYSWLRLGSGKNLALGVIPSKSSFLDGAFDKKHTSFKIINSPNSKNYDKAKRTYIQFYDDRLADEEQILGDEEINYENYFTQNPYEISKYEDTPVPYKIELALISKNDLARLKKLESFQRGSIDDVPSEFLKFDGISLATRENAANAGFWCGSSDLIQTRIADASELGSESSYQVKNYIYGIGTYWTKLTANALKTHLATIFANDDGSASETIANNFRVKASELNKIRENVEDNFSLSRTLNKKRTLGDNFLLNEIVNYPLEAIEFGDDLTAVLGGHFVTARSDSSDETSRLDTVLKNFETNYPSAIKMNSLYKKTITPLVKKVLANVESELKKTNPSITIFENDGSLSDFGAFVAQDAVPEIVRQIFVNAFNKDATDGVNYDYGALAKTGLLGLGITKANSPSPEHEARAIVNILGNRLSLLNKSEKLDKFAQNLAKKYQNINAQDYVQSEAVIDFLGAGLNWRFDAAKEVGDIDKLYDNSGAFEEFWQDVNSFWTNFIKHVKEENPNAYVIAEITDIGDLYHDVKESEAHTLDFGAFENPESAFRTFYNKTGATTSSDYNFMFNSIPRFFGYSLDEQKPFPGSTEIFFHRDMEGKYMNTSSLVSIINGHTFLGNHDKTRPLFYMALGDMRLYLGHESMENYYEKLKDLISYVALVPRQNLKNEKVHFYSNEAMVVGKLYKDNIKKILKNSENKEVRAYLYNAIADLAKGTSLDAARSFGSDDFEYGLIAVFERAKQLALESGDSETAKKLGEIQDDTIVKILKLILEKPMKDFAKMWELMNITVGNPTMYAGDEYGLTGFETVAKNIRQKNRNPIDHEKINQEGREFAKEFNKRINAISKMHTLSAFDLGLSKTKDENGDIIYPMSAIADGTPIVVSERSDIKTQAHKIKGVYKYNDKGSEVLSLVVPLVAFKPDMKYKNIRLYNLPVSYDTKSRFAKVQYKDGKYTADLSTIYKMSVERVDAEMGVQKEQGGRVKVVCIQEENGKEFKLDDINTIFVKI